MSTLICKCGNPLPYSTRTVCFTCYPKGKRGLPMQQRTNLITYVQIRCHGHGCDKLFPYIAGRYFRQWERNKNGVMCSHSCACRFSQATDTYHRICECGNELPVSRRSAVSKYFGKCFICWPKGKHDIEMVTLVCGTCGKQFTITRTWEQRRLKQKQTLAEKNNIPFDGKLFCSRSCGNRGASNGIGLNEVLRKAAGQRFKRQPGWSDEQWEWEKKLQTMGLGMSAGQIRHASWGDVALKTAEAQIINRGQRRVVTRNKV